MICSARELGLGDDHDGIIVLPSVGARAAGAGRATTRSRCSAWTSEVVEVNVTPDRGYCFAVRGIAREYAHATGARVPRPGRWSTVPRAERRRLPRSGSTTTRRSAARVGCDRYVARVVRGVDAAAALAALDAAAAQPGRDAPDLARRRRHQLRHARARPAAARLRPRPAERPDRGPPGPAAGEQLTTLDDVDRALDPRTC